MNRLHLLTILVLTHSLSLHAQDETASEGNFLSRVFLPSIDVGYQLPNSSLIEGALRFSTAIEYRFRNNNDFFVRLSYDTYNPRYLLSNTGTTNAIEGTATMTDVFFAPGYRFGDNKMRMMISFMPGLKLYEFPTAEFEGTQIIISQEGKQLFTTSLLATVEYYFDEKSAFTLSLSQNSVWKKVDFWEDGTSAIAFSLGFITSLM